MNPTALVPRRGASLAVCALVLPLWCAAATRAQARPVQFPAPIFEVERISLEGRLGPPPPHSSATALTLGYKANIYEFQLIRLRVLNGNTLNSRILANVQPYRPNFLLRGSAAEMRKLAAARPRDYVEIVGWIHTGGRDMLVSSIQVQPAAAAASPTPE